MATHPPNPLHPPTRLSPSNLQLRSSARSPSPNRLAVPDYQSIDPLLGTLSPEATLEALASANAVPTNERGAQDILAQSISQVSPAERALGIRAAVAAQKLGHWYREIQGWDWPKRTDTHLGEGFIPPSIDPTEGVPDKEYYGSLPAAVVVQHEKRIEEIRDGMENLNVDELKEHVLSAHIPARSRPSSANSTVSVPPPLSYVQLSDFTAVITATILRALPLLSRLNSLLSAWDVRLLVLRQIPGLLRALRLARSELNLALDLLKSTEPPSEADPLYSRANYHVKRAALEASVLSAGRRMDRILDSLEGREDSLPEAWIDELETIESEFGSWVMEAEKRSVQNEWRRSVTKKQKVRLPEPEPIQPVSPLDESSKAEQSASDFHSPSDSTRPLPMETIEEEPSSPLKTAPAEAASLDRAAAVLPSIEAATPETSSRLLSESSESNALDPPRDVQSDECETQVDISQVDNGLPDASMVTRQSLSTSDAADCEPTEPIPMPMGQNDVCSNDMHRDPDLHIQDDSVLLERPVDPSVNNDFQGLAGSPYTQDNSPETVETHRDKSPSPSSFSAGVPSSPRLEYEPEDDVTPLYVNGGAARPVENISTPCGVESSRESDAHCRMNESHHPLSSISDQRETQNTGAQLTVPGPTAAVQVYENDLSTSQSSIPSLDSSTSNASENDEKPVSSLTNTPEEADKDPPSKRPLESPIKLSKGVTSRSHPEKPDAKSRGRRSSMISAASYSDYPSLISSPELRGPHTASSNGTPLPLETPPQLRPRREPSDPTPSNKHTLRADRLLGLENDVTPPRTALKHNRALSLPLQRFINERLELDYENEASPNMESPTAEKGPRGEYPPVRLSSRPASAPWSQKKNRLSAPPKPARPHGHTKQLRSSFEGSPMLESDVEKFDMDQQKHNKPDGQKKEPERPYLEPPIHIAAARLRRQLASHPSLEDIGRHRSLTEDSSTSSLLKDAPRPPQSNRLKKPKDQMDEKISSILTSIPGNIALMQADDSEHETSSIASFPLKPRELRSVSRAGSSSRSGTPGPGLTITPAPARRRHSHAPGANAMKVYHLHGGEKPVKLACRTVGRNGERVMARIGGGWSDLAEYLTVYAMHHRSRHFSEAPRVEVQELSSRESTPSYASPATRVVSGNNGRDTPSRPTSVMSNRPPSSLAVRKTRRSSNASDVAGLRAVSAGASLNVSGTPLSTVSSRRRLSVSSNTSVGAVSSANYSPSTTIGGTSPTIPLGLAGPKPRSRRISMTPESEAWVEDVLGQARRSASLRPLPSSLGVDQESTGRRTPALAKSRSINDISAAGSSRRVALRGLGGRLN
ncbi:hypothetical protein BDV59DRAFT_6870 [Aspergillus ambiguus]|uniref:GAS2 domain protein n=1 Tax=Aspergillus ambiguus TaxID=176160 RepID=UPI003CCD22EF